MTTSTHSTWTVETSSCWYFVVPHVASTTIPLAPLSMNTIWLPSFFSPDSITSSLLEFHLHYMNWKRVRLLVTMETIRFMPRVGGCMRHRPDPTRPVQGPCVDQTVKKCPTLPPSLMEPWCLLARDGCCCDCCCCCCRRRCPGASGVMIVFFFRSNGEGRISACLPKSPTQCCRSPTD
jgi:hypothetical protein